MPEAPAAGRIELRPPRSAALVTISALLGYDFVEIDHHCAGTYIGPPRLLRFLAVA